MFKKSLFKIAQTNCFADKQAETQNFIQTKQKLLFYMNKLMYSIDKP